jgi:hypothetical protein
MSRLIVLLLTGILIFLPVGPVLAQQSDSIAELQQQIKRMEAVNADPATPADVKSLNDEFLKARRTQLHDLLVKNIEALRKYQASVGSSLTAEEISLLESRIQNFEKALQEQEEGAGVGGHRAAVPIEESGTRPQSARPSLAANIDSPRNEALRARPATDSAAAVNSVALLPCSASVANLPPRLDDMAQATAILVVNRAVAVVAAGKDIATDSKIGGEFGKHYDELVYWNVADALFTGAQQVSLRKLKWQEFSAETARTDKQIGSSSRSGGSTSLAEKPGFADLLGFAIEHGAIQKEVSDTTLTLSTSPYAMIAAAQGDTSDVYRSHDFFTRIGVAANFNLDNKDNVLGNASRRQLNNWSVKVRLNRDRTARGADFQNFWDKNVLPRIEKRAIVLATGFDRAFNKVKDLRDLYDAVQLKFEGPTGFLVTVLKANAGAARPAQEAALKQEILCRLRTEVYEPVKSGTTVSVDAEFLEFLNKSAVDFAEAQLAAEEGKQEVLAELQRLNDKPIASLGYTNVRPIDGPSYSVFKGLYLQKAFSPMKVLANGELSIYNNPKAVLNQQRIRDFLFALSFEGSAGRSPFISTDMDQSPITFSFTGSYQRLLENNGVAGRKADLGSAQFKMDIPVFTGFSLPLSVSYINATEERNKSGFRFNFGFGLDTDKLAALLRAKRQ